MVSFGPNVQGGLNNIQFLPSNHKVCDFFSVLSKKFYSIVACYDRRERNELFNDLML